VVLAVLAVIPWAHVGVRSQTRSAGSTQPAIRSRVDAITLSVAVTDRDGTRIEGLGPQDFRVTFDGQPRRVVSADGVARAPASTEAGLAGREFPFVSGNDRRPSGQLVMLVIDEEGLRFSTRGAVQASAGFVDALPASDLLGLTVLPDGPRIPYTRDRALIREAIGSVRGRWQPRVGQIQLTEGEAFAINRGDQTTRSVVAERECPDSLPTATAERRRADQEECLETIDVESRAQVLALEDEAKAALRRLSDLLESVAVTGTEAPIALVYVSGGLTLLPPSADITTVAAAALRANAVIHTIQPDPNLADLDRRGRRMALSYGSREVSAAGLQELSELSGGRFVSPIGSAALVLAGLATELAGGYRVGVELRAGDVDGQVHRVQVETPSRPSIVRSQRRFSSARPGYRGAAEPLTSVLRHPRWLTGVPLRVATYARRASTTGAIELIIAGDIGPGEPGKGQAAYSVIDARGREALAGDQEFVIEAGADGKAARGRLLARGDLSPGAYVLRLAARTADGQLGTVEHPVHAALDPFGSILVGDLLLTPGAGEEGGRVVPVAECEIAGQPLVALIELYSERGAAPSALRPTLEIFAAGQEARLLDAPMDARDAEDKLRLFAQATVSTALLSPGSYDARVLVTIGGDRIEVARRPFRIVEPEPAAGPATPASGVEVRSAISDVLRSLVPPFDVKAMLQPETVERDLRRAVRRSGASSSVVTAVPDAARRGSLTFDDVPSAVEKDAPLVAAMGRGLALLGASRYDAAASQFRRATTIASDYLTALVYLGACFAGQGRDEDAAGAWQTAMVADDGSARVHVLASDALLRRGMPDEAIDLLNEAALTWPDDDAVPHRLGLALAIARRPGDAMKAIEPMLNRSDPPPDTLFLGLVLLQQAKLTSTPIVSPESDRARVAALAAAYLAGSGTRKGLAKAWADAARTPPE
jgi:VWFA-related protein